MNIERKLYQWDTGQKLVGCTGLYVDFPIGDEVYRVETTDGMCIIPDELLQTSGGHKVYECMTNNTIRSFAFSVTPRPQPPDYVFTPTERLTFEGLVQKVDDAVADMIRRAESGEFDGHTPVKGTDYFTASEIQQIQNEVSSGAIGEFKSVVDTETETFNTNAETKLSAYNQNDSQKTTSYNTNATKKLNEYNTNANNRVAEFDSHTEQIQADISELKSDLGDYHSITWTENTYVHVDSGNVLSNDYFCSSDFIPVTPSGKIVIKQLWITANDIGLVWYDSDKNYLNGEEMVVSLGELVERTIPNDARYLRFSCRKGYQDNCSIDSVGMKTELKALSSIAYENEKKVTGVMYREETESVSFDNLNTGSINAVGTLSPSQTAFRYTQDFVVTKGSTLKVVCTGYSTNVAIISEHKNGAFIPLVLSVDSTEHTYEWVADETKTVVICFWNAYSKRAAIITTHDINLIERNVEKLNKHSNMWSYALNEVLCIGDSLTAGATPNEDWGEVTTVHQIVDNYPNMIKRMLNANVTNGGYSGYSASNWLSEKASNYNFADYDTFIIWLGTNNALDYSNEETSLRGIINAIREANNSCLIVLGTIFACTNGTVIGNNKIVNSIALEFNLPVVDFSDLSQTNREDLRGGINNNPHFGKAGNIFIADRIIRTLGEWFESDHTRCEYGYRART